MRGATCAIFMMTFTSPDEYKRVQCSKVPLRPDMTDFNKNVW